MRRATDTGRLPRPAPAGSRDILRPHTVATSRAARHAWRHDIRSDGGSTFPTGQGFCTTEVFREIAIRADGRAIIAASAAAKKQREDGQEGYLCVGELSFATGQVERLEHAA